MKSPSLGSINNIPHIFNKRRVSGVTVKQGDPIRFHDRLAADWESKYQKASFQGRMKAFLSLLDGISLSDEKWLDAGCGSGVLTRALASRCRSVTGVDASSDMIQVARNSNSNQTHSVNDPVFEVVETIERLEFAESSFDGVLCSSVLEYLKDPGEAIAQFYRVLRPGGVLLVSVPNKKSLLRRTQKLLHSILKNCLGIDWPAYLAFSRHSYTYPSFVQLLRSNDFTVESAIGYGPYMPNISREIRFTKSIIICLARKKVSEDLLITS
jgi:2-polyprenyl-6-hydroxyphenyl methylase/3-demethylubiquinone-9 3-methyltransferase